MRKKKLSKREYNKRLAIFKATEKWKRDRARGGQKRRAAYFGFTLKEWNALPQEQRYDYVRFYDMLHTLKNLLRAQFGGLRQLKPKDPKQVIHVPIKLRNGETKEVIAQVMKKPLSDEQKEELIKLTQGMMEHISYLKYESGFTWEKFEYKMREDNRTEREIEEMKMFYDIA
jgi:hypothetical protein